MTEVLRQVALGFWITLCQMAPYLLFGFLVAGILSVFIKPEWVERHLGRRGLWSSVKASLFGVPLPLCSCGVIPVGASLRRHGAGKGATTSFLISTPQTGVDSVFVTWSLLGPVYAVFRPLAAFVSGVFGGMLVTLFGDEDTPDANGAGTKAACDGACCTKNDGKSKARQVLEYGFVTLAEDIGPSLFVDLVLAGVISALVPTDFFAETLGKGIVAMLVMMALGIPVYVCATASIPIAAALIVKGASPGAAFAFLMTGPATNAATVTTIWKTMGTRTAVLYLVSVATSAMAFGLTLDFIFRIEGVPAPQMMHEHGPAVWQMVSAVVLLAVLVHAIIRSRLGGGAVGETKENAGMRVTFTIEGMTCSHCAAAVQRALSEGEGVASAAVDLHAKRAVVTGEQLDAAALKAAVESVGYTAEIIETEETMP